MVKIRAGALSSIIFKTGKPKIVPDAQFDVPPYLLKKLTAPGEATSLASASRSRLSSKPAEPQNVYRELFKTSRNAEEKAAMGSLLLGNGITLPVSQMAAYIRSLMYLNRIPQALSEYKRLSGSNERTYWRRLGISLLCKCHRVALAEQLLDPSSGNEPEISLAFIEAYADLCQDDKVDLWIDRLFRCQPSIQCSNQALRAAVTATLWPQARKIIRSMSRLKQSIDSELLARCIFSVKQEVPTLSWVTMLSEDGSLINIKLFRNLLGTDARYKLDDLLMKDKLTDAVDFVMKNRGLQNVSLSYQLIQHLKRSSSKDHTVDPDVLNALVDKVESSPVKNSIYVQFMLAYYDLTNKYEEFWEFIVKYSLTSRHPKIRGKMSSSNHNMIWKIIAKYLRKQSKQNDLTFSRLPINLRSFAAITLCNTALRPVLLRNILLSLNSIPDLPAIVTIIEFANKCSGVEISDDLIESLTGEKFKSTEETGSSSKQKAKFVCTVANADFHNIVGQSKQFRKDIYFV